MPKVSGPLLALGAVGLVALAMARKKKPKPATDEMIEVTRVTWSDSKGDSKSREFSYRSIAETFADTMRDAGGEDVLVAPA